MIEVGQHCSQEWAVNVIIPVTLMKALGSRCAYLKIIQFLKGFDIGVRDGGSGEPVTDTTFIRANENTFVWLTVSPFAIRAKLGLTPQMDVGPYAGFCTDRDWNICRTHRSLLLAAVDSCCLTRRPGCQGEGKRGRGRDGPSYSEGSMSHCSQSLKTDGELLWILL